MTFPFEENLKYIEAALKLCVWSSKLRVLKVANYFNFMTSFLKQQSSRGLNDNTNSVRCGFVESLRTEVKALLTEYGQENIRNRL